MGTGCINRESVTITVMTREPQVVAEPETMELAPMLQSVAENWLAWQCTMISGTCHGVIALGVPDQGPYRPTACWPEGSDPSVALSKTAQAAIAKRKGVVAELKSSNPGEGVDKDAIGIIGRDDVDVSRACGIGFDVREGVHPEGLIR